MTWRERLVLLLLALAILLSLVDLASSAPPQAPRPPQAPPMRATYAEQRARAIAEVRPLVVGVDCDPPAGDWLACRVESFEGVSGRGIVVSRPEYPIRTQNPPRLLWLETLSCHATAEQIRASLQGRGRFEGNLAAPASVRAAAPAASVFFGSFGGGGRGGRGGGGC